MKISIIGKLLASYSGKSETEINGLLYKDPSAETKEFRTEEEITSSIDDLLTAKLSAVTDKSKTVGEDQRKRGVREAMSSHEKAIKAKYGISSELKGEELVDFIVNEKLKSVKSGTGANALTLENALENPIVQQVVKSKLDPIIAERDKISGEFDTYKTGIEATNSAAVIKEQLIAAYTKAKAKLGEGDSRTVKINSLLDRRYFDPANFKVEKLADGTSKITPIDSNGNPLKDSHMNDVTFESYALAGNPYGVDEFDQSKGGTGAAPAAGGTPPSGGAKPTQEEQVAYLKRTDITDAQKEEYYNTHMAD